MISNGKIKVYAKISIGHNVSTIRDIPVQMELL